MKICGTTIYMVRGDSESINIVLTDIDGLPYNFSIGDDVILTIAQVSPVYGAYTTILQKTTTISTVTNSATIDILSTDTEGLSYDYEYKWDVQWTRVAGSSPRTIIPNADFKFIKEVTV